LIFCLMANLLSFTFFIISGIQGFYQFSIFSASHFTFAIFFIVIYLFTQSLNIFFFVATRKYVRENTESHQLKGTHAQSTKILMKKLMPHIMIGMTVITCLFFLGGAAIKDILDHRIHGIFFIFALLHYTYLIKLLMAGFRRATRDCMAIAKLLPH